MNELEYLLIPLSDITTDHPLPFTIYTSDSYDIILDTLTRNDIERAFRLKIEDTDEVGGYAYTSTDGKSTEVGGLPYMLFSSSIKLCVVPKKSDAVNADIRERVSLALKCVIGYFDEYASWVQEPICTIAFRGEHRAYSSSYRLAKINQEEADKIAAIMDYKDNGELPEHKFNTLSALINAASMQSRALDVSCILYISILEAIYVQDNGELTYRLSMRVSRKLGKDLDFARHIRKLYSKRSKVIHGSSKGGVFSSEEHLEIEKIAKLSLIAYILDPLAYSEDSLDELLLR